MVAKEILLVHKNEGHRQLEEKINGSLWQGGEKIFSSEAEACQNGWKVDAVKVILASAELRDDPGIIELRERVAA